MRPTSALDVLVKALEELGGDLGELVLEAHKTPEALHAAPHNDDPGVMVLAGLEQVQGSGAACMTCDWSTAVLGRFEDFVSSREPYSVELSAWLSACEAAGRGVRGEYASFWDAAGLLEGVVELEEAREETRRFVSARDAGHRGPWVLALVSTWGKGWVRAEVKALGIGEVGTSVLVVTSRERFEELAGEDLEVLEALEVPVRPGDDVLEAVAVLFKPGSGGSCSVLAGALETAQAL